MFNIILAIDKNNGIAKNGDIPWYLPNDLKYFKRLTSATNLQLKENAVIMGRKTCESLPNKFLPNRLNIVLTRNPSYNNDNVSITDDFNKALQICKNKNVDTIWVIGGSEIYNLALVHPKLNKIYITLINHDFDCDQKVVLPKFNVLDSVSFHDTDEKSDNVLDILNIIAEPVLNAEQKYLNLLDNILKKGDSRVTRNGITFSLFSNDITFNVSESFPLLTTKKMFWRGIVEELLFFIRGDIDTKKLEEKKINIWKGNTSKDFLSKMELNYEEGIMGPMYGYQWRFFNKPLSNKTGGIDQLKEMIEMIKRDPYSRRMLMTDFNPSQVNEGVLYPCHSLILQFYVEDKNLSVKMYQRSADVFLGLPFNIASTSLLLYMISKICKLNPWNVSICLGDCHIYESHIDAVKEQLSRTCSTLPKLEIPDFKTLEDVEKSKFEDYKIEDYNYQPSIKAEMIA